jgi:epoxyqueuosine reductase
MRAKRRGLLRNVCVALGNAVDPAAVEPLAEALRTETEPLVRGHAAWALGRLGAGRPLAEALRTETDPYVQEEIELAYAAL